MRIAEGFVTVFTSWRTNLSPFMGKADLVKALTAACCD